MAKNDALGRGVTERARRGPMLELTCQASVPRDAFPPTPPDPEGSNGNGLLRVQWVSGAWLKSGRWLSALGCSPRFTLLPHPRCFH